jgi:ABC-type glycerol-3-phosphate transport system substrate-binding protein
MLRNPGESDELNDYKTKYAWKFLKYLTSADVNGKMCANDSNGYVPVRKSAYETDFYKTFLEGGTVEAQVASIVKNDISGHYFVTPAFKGSATARTAVGNTILTQVFLGNSNIDDAFTKAYNDTLLQM